MKRQHTLRYRLATLDDVPALVALRQANTITEQDFQHADALQQGFLVEPVTPAQVQEELTQQRCQYVLAMNARDEALLGLCRVQVKDVMAQLDSRHCVWLEEQAYQKLHSNGHRHIRTVAVHPQHRHQGVGRALYDQVFHQFPNSVFSAFIVRQPVENTASLRFHQQLGFREVAIFQPVGTQFGIHGFQASLLMKDEGTNER